MNPEDPVEVTNRDGETPQGTLVKVLSVTANQYHFVSYDDDGELTSIVEYWADHGGCDPQARVVIVELTSGEYAYPEDKVEVLVRG